MLELSFKIIYQEIKKIWSRHEKVMDKRTDGGHDIYNPSYGGRIIIE